MSALLRVQLLLILYHIAYFDWQKEQFYLKKLSLYKSIHDNRKWPPLRPGVEKFNYEGMGGIAVFELKK